MSVVPKGIVLKIGIVFAILLLILAKSVLNSNGVCIPKLRVLSDEELVNIYLLGPSWETMTPEERRVAALAKWGTYLPDCCNVSYSYHLSHRKIYDTTPPVLEIDHPVSNPSGARMYEQIYVDLQPCGFDNETRKSMALSEKEYHAAVENNKRYWQEIK